MRLTPLNIISALLLAWGAYGIFFQQAGNGWKNLIFTLLGAVFVWAVDMMFRQKLKNLKRIWFTELSFLIFAAVLVVVIKSIFRT